MSKILEEEKKKAKKLGEEQRRFFRRGFDEFFRGEDSLKISGKELYNDNRRAGSRKIL